MIYDLRLDIRYDFGRPIAAARQHLRIMPREIPGRQSIDRQQLLIDPAPVDRREFTDFFGNRVVDLVMPPGITSLRLDLTARVRCEEQGPALDLSTPLAGLAADLGAQCDLGPASPQHFAGPSPRIGRLDALTDFARAAVSKEITAREATERLGRALHAHMTFDAEATDVDTPPARAFAQRRGVCQDFAQIMIAGLRGLGIPAGYVGGFLRTLPPPGKPRLEGADAMHAWVRAWCGAKAGWLEYDPTNACWAGADHIVSTHGRDYGDVAPVIGALRTEGDQVGGHSVDIVETAA